jgi:hypothetical protein
MNLNDEHGPDLPKRVAYYGYWRIPWDKWYEALALHKPVAQFAPGAPAGAGEGQWYCSQHRPKAAL